MLLRAVKPEDLGAIASIYNEGIAGREATFETELRSPTDFKGLTGREALPALVAEVDGRVVGAAWTTPYSERACYSGILECSVYVEVASRGSGIGTDLCEELATLADQGGFHKLLGKVFVSNEASRRLTRRCGFREVGLHLRHGRLDGEWRDVLVVERLLPHARATTGG
ncbi:MAG TPA: arsinothricin resistance N-acetyltransferase ArsN1 family A [Solirubrobacterales bacterium]|nr:arsinothricin resistance N-acetyltransferase ArsN1 family A [Solirubrobacterales bacterium]